MNDAAPPNLDTLWPHIAAGDEEAFARFVAASEQTVRRSLRSFASLLDTEALVQETYLRVWQSAARFVPDGREGSSVRFAVRVARNLAVSELRRRREVLVESVVDEPAPEPGTVDPLLRSVIARCLEALLGPARVALFARIESAGHDPDAVLAARVGMRPNTFLQNVTRARRSLVTCLENQGIHLQEGA